MASNSLSLPVDIPWERWCVSEDMMDKEACDSDRPAKWQSSIAVFKYVPEEDYQSYKGRKITYVKIVCTITGYQPKKEEIQGILSNWAGITGSEIAQAEFEKILSDIRPCIQAIVQVTVTPLSGEKVKLADYPYIMDFQPKKRELYEMASDTKEFMSRSMESLDIRKSAGATASQEILDIDQGFNLGVNFQYQGTGGGLQYGNKGEVGTKTIGGSESGLVRTADESRERRETVSHTTQITQLYHLLDSYHQGTNRAVFLMQPRPHVIAGTDGFVSSEPRPLDGIQEFFFVINQPENQDDFCLDVRLDTGHLYEKPIKEYKFKTDTFEPEILSNPMPVDESTGGVFVEDVWLKKFEDGCTIELPFIGKKTIWSYEEEILYKRWKRILKKSSIYTPKQGGPQEVEYQIDVQNIQKASENVDGYHVLSDNIIGDANRSINTTGDGETLTVNMEATTTALKKAPFDTKNVKINAKVDVGALAEAVALVSANFFDPVLAAQILSFSGMMAAGGIATVEGAKSLAAYIGAPEILEPAPSSIESKLQVFLKSREEIDTGLKERTFFITTRGLCSCKEQEIQPGDGEGNEGFVYEGNVPIWKGSENVTIVESRKLHAAIHNEMLQSLVSPRRTAPRSLMNTKMVTALVLPIIMQNPVARIYLSQPSADAIPATLEKSLPKSFRNNLKQISRLDLLTLNTPVLTHISGLDEASVHQLRVAMLTEPLKEPEVLKQTKTFQQPE